VPSERWDIPTLQNSVKSQQTQILTITDIRLGQKQHEFYWGRSTIDLTFTTAKLSHKNWEFFSYYNHIH
jgi:hypothetical protein